MDLSLYLGHIPNVVGLNPGTVYWMDIFSHIFVAKNCNFCLKRPKKRKRGRGLPILKNSVKLSGFILPCLTLHLTCRCSRHGRAHHLRCSGWRAELYARVGAQLPLVVVRARLCRGHLPVHRRSSVHHRGEDYAEVAGGHGEALPDGAASLRRKVLTSFKVLNLQTNFLCFKYVYNSFKSALESLHRDVNVAMAVRSIKSYKVIAVPSRKLKIFLPNRVRKYHHTTYYLKLLKSNNNLYFDVVLTEDIPIVKYLCESILTWTDHYNSMFKFQRRLNVPHPVKVFYDLKLLF